MINALTKLEKQVCEALVGDDTYCSERGLDDTHPYMAAVAAAMLANDLGDKAMASLGRMMVQQFQRDIANAVAQQELDNKIAADTLEALEEANAKLERRLGMAAPASIH
ncbi:hypothetical protein [Ralstonia holmesii]|uniref:hypothetical protein n=1 Tax=Ralstonia holmesii TaxID=3058602 RepID=UPI0028F65931|nr:hypothetical protein [Ralstonia sp. LMG 32967]CAJ0698682.1 hypothetical protein R11007_02859 [Ralstonia sp. LMG 32967]